MTELRKLKRNFIKAEELQRVIEHISGRVNGMESSEDFAEFIADRVTTGKELISPEEYSAKIKAVTAEDVRNCARALFRNNRLSLAIVGPVEEKSRKKITSLLRV
jgi:predicted Zn-dependent peptidase